MLPAPELPFHQVDVSLHNSFCIDFFLKAVDLALSCDDFQVIVRTLVFIYNHSGRFSGEFRKKLFLDLIVRKHFFKLSLHWSFLVRWHYHFLIVYKIRRRGFVYSYEESLDFVTKKRRISGPHLHRRVSTAPKPSGWFESFFGTSPKSSSTIREGSPGKEVGEASGSLSDMTVNSDWITTYADLSRDDIEDDEYESFVLYLTLFQHHRVQHHDIQSHDRAISGRNWGFAQFF
jgi:hypothetical protein